MLPPGRVPVSDLKTKFEQVLSEADKGRYCPSDTGFNPATVEAVNNVAAAWPESNVTLMNRAKRVFAEFLASKESNGSQ